MAVRNKQEMLDKIKDILGENTTDEALSLVEDINDTYDDFDNRTKDSTDWKQKYTDLDSSWRKKYRDRFFNGEPAQDNNPPAPVTEDVNEDVSFDDCFTEE